MSMKSHQRKIWDDPIWKLSIPMIYYWVGYVERTSIFSVQIELDSLNIYTIFVPYFYIAIIQNCFGYIFKLVLNAFPLYDGEVL